MFGCGEHCIHEFTVLYVWSYVGWMEVGRGLSRPITGIMYDDVSLLSVFPQSMHACMHFFVCLLYLVHVL